jgi:PKHD-type hydroxylase
MYSKNRWYYFTEAIDKSTCDKIRNVADDKWKTAEIKGTDQNIRKSNVVWTDDQWLYDIVWPYMRKANIDAGWKYEIEIAEDMQITRYKEGDFYSWHKDGKGDHFSVYTGKNTITQNRVRKLSMSILLNDDFEGGEFQFTHYSKEKCDIHTSVLNKTGSVIVFPSDTEHRVTPVTKGIRYSLVAWFLGPPYV